MSRYSNILLRQLVLYFNFKPTCCQYTIKQICLKILSLGCQYFILNDKYIVWKVIPFLYIHACVK
jgi:hypothetical protein